MNRLSEFGGSLGLCLPNDGFMPADTKAGGWYISRDWGFGVS